MGHRPALTAYLAAALLLCAACGQQGSATSLPSPQTAALPTLMAPASPEPSTPTQPPAPTDWPSPTAAGVPTAEPRPEPTPALAEPEPTPALAEPDYGYPIGVAGRPLGDGFFVRHGYAAENTWYNPNHWHTGEDWYAIEGDAAGARVYAVAAGQVVYAGSNYPGRVVIVQHDDGLFAMYGHLDPALAVAEGQRVARGDPIGTVLRRGDDVPNHLHFEIRTFLREREVNGDAPRYGFRCGRNCAPGPGYWPLRAPDHPSELGWRNPTHVIGRRGIPPEVVVSSAPAAPSAALWSAPPAEGDATQAGDLPLVPGAHYRLTEVRAGAEDTGGTSAASYELWYRIVLPDGVEAWVQGAVPSSFETGGDGRPSSVSFNFLPAVTADS